MSLTTELEARRGKPYTQILEEILAITHDVISPIEGRDLRDVVTVLASGLDHRLLMAEPSALRTGLMRAFNSMSIAEFGFNLADPVVAQMLDAGVNAGLVDVNERLWFYGIATKQVQTYPDLTLLDVVKYFQPGLVDGEWHDLGVSSGTLVTLHLSSRPPEATSIIIEVQDLSGEWCYGSAIGGVYVAKPSYSAPIPYFGQARGIRWKCDYLLNGVVSVS